MEYIHKRGVIHRDLKCENILITDNNIAKIADFGLSKYIKKSAKLHSVIGTPDYFAPEMLTDHSYDFKVAFLHRWTFGVSAAYFIT